MISQRLSTVILLLICLFTGYYLFNKQRESDQQISPDAEQPLFTAEGVATSNYDENGIRTYRLQSDHIEHFQQSDETHFNLPVLLTYSDGTDPEWKMTADFAVLEDKRMLVMSGNVNIMNLLPETQVKLITTDQLTLDLSSKDFWSNDETRILGVNFETRGNWIKGNFSSHQVELIQQVKSRYELESK